MSCDQALYVKVIDLLMEELSAAGSAHPLNVQNARTSIQAVSTVCKQAGHRFGDHVERVMPLIISYAKMGEEEELREHCLQACRPRLVSSDFYHH